jgi:hypothetical protein
MELEGCNEPLDRARPAFTTGLSGRETGSAFAGQALGFSNTKPDWAAIVAGKDALPRVQLKEDHENVGPRPVGSSEKP